MRKLKFNSNFGIWYFPTIAELFERTRSFNLKYFNIQQKSIYISNIFNSCIPYTHVLKFKNVYSIPKQSDHVGEIGKVDAQQFCVVLTLQ